MEKDLCSPDRTGRAYEIIERLKQNNETELLSKLADGVEDKRSRTISSMKYGSYLLTGRIATVRNSLNRSYFTFTTILVQENGIYAAAL